MRNNGERISEKIIKVHRDLLVVIPIIALLAGCNMDGSDTLPTPQPTQEQTFNPEITRDQLCEIYGPSRIGEISIGGSEYLALENGEGEWVVISGNTITPVVNISAVRNVDDEVSITIGEGTSLTFTLDTYSNPRDVSGVFDGKNGEVYNLRSSALCQK